MIVRLIAAVGVHGQIGLNGALPWRDSEDLKFFKRETMGSVVVMGSKTAAGLNLPGRRIHVMKRSETPQDVIGMYLDEPHIWIAGGATIYRIWMPYVRMASITLTGYRGPADTFMPPLWDNSNLWEN